MPTEWLSALIPTVLTFLICFVIAAELETLLVKVSDFLNNAAWDKLFFPLSWLYDVTLGKLFSWLSEALSGTWFGQADRTLARKRMGGIRPLIWAIVSLGFVVFQLVTVPDALEDLVMNYLTGTAIGAPVAFLLDGLSFSLPVIIGAGFTRFLSTEAMRQQNGEEADSRPEMHLLAKSLYGLIFLGAFSLLGGAMSGFFEKASNTITTLADKIGGLELFAGSAGFWDWFYLIVSIIGVIVLGYLWLVLVFMALKEYISNISYCLLPLSVLALTTGILSIFGLTSVTWLSAILFFVALAVGEWHRYQMENDPIRRERYLRFMNHFRLFTNHILPWLKRRAAHSLCPCSPCSIFRFFR